MNKLLLTILIISAIVAFATVTSGAEIGPRIDIFVGPGDQGFHGISNAFNPINNRFLVVTTEGGWTTPGVSLDGQLVNTDGTLYGSPIVISPPGQNFDPHVTFDPENKRFLVVWWYSGNVYGQLINSDGSLNGNNFNISPIYHYIGFPRVQFDTINKRFFVVWTGISTAYPSNLYGQFVNPDGSLHGSMIQVTDYENYAAAYPEIEFDSNNGRFLMTWGNQFDGYIYGRLINSDGTFYGSETTIGYYGLGNSYTASLSFDPVNSRFLQVWGGSGQMINADGSLYGTEISFFNPGYATLSGFNDVIFDTGDNKFLVAESIEYPYLGIAGQLVSPDGSLSGQDFKIFEVIYPGREGNMGSYIPSVAFGSAESGSLVAYMDIPNLSISGIDIFGNLVKLGNSNLAPVLDPIGSKTVNELALLQFTVTASDTDLITLSASNLPSGATFDPTTGIFSWTPDATQAGTYPGVHFEVSDGSLTDSEDITIHVIDVVTYGTILGISFNDINGNMIFDSGEIGLEKWTIKLEGYDNVAHKSIKIQVFTDASGNYRFTRLNPGTYRISEKLKPKWTNTTPDSFSVNIVSGDIIEYNFGNIRK